MNYLKRNIDSELLKWKEDPTRKPILLRGARQVGKSWSVRKLGTYFKYFIEINLEKRRDLIPLFSELTDVHEITKRLGVITGVPVTPGETLLFIDEIQFSPDAIKMLRYFKEDFPELHVIAAGSLLEFALETLPSFGVGRVKSLFMYPFSFTEFLSALGKDTWITEIETASAANPIFNALHKDIVQTYRTFLMVGGMPASVATWVTTRDYHSCAIEQDEIRQGYFDDFSKYAKKISPELLKNTLQSVALQTGSKFIYSKVAPEVRLADVKQALNLLSQAGIIKEIKMSSASGLPLGATVNPKFSKYFLLDTGLLLRILDMDLNSNQKISELILAGSTEELVNKGSIAEMFVGWEILKSQSPLMQHDIYYWENTSKGASSEVDFVMAYEMSILPIEVKSGTSGKMKSLRMFMDSKNIDTAIRTSLENFQTLHLNDDRKILIVPLYAIYRYKNILSLPFHLNS